MENNEEKVMTLLKVLCISVWAFVVILFCVTLIVLDNQTKISQNNGVVVKGNHNETTIIVNESYEGVPTLESYAEKVQKASLSLDRPLSNKEAKEISLLIFEAANNHNLSPQAAFTIVHVESDFKKNAYNRRGKAYGLCQVTEPCLQEYNNYHSVKYNAEDLLNPKTNLEVGFWYYNRLLTHYKKYSSYGICDLQDAYLAYNIGVTKFRGLGDWGRDTLRSGIYPIAMYGANRGDRYEPLHRFQDKEKEWIAA